MNFFNKIFKKKEEDDKNPESRNSKLPACLPACPRRQAQAGAGREIRKEAGSDSGAGEVNLDKENIKEEKRATKTENALIAHRILIKPRVTEKTANLAKENKYVFEVANGINKIEVKKALEAVYGVAATDVNIIKMKGKKTGAMRRIFGKRKDWKKAVVTLKNGESIDVYSTEDKKQRR